MVDMHTHLLYGIDDGAQNESEAIEMAKAAIQVGTHAVIVTPHHNNDSYSNPKNIILQKLNDLQVTLRHHHIALDIYPGQEVRLKKNLFEEYEKGNLLTLNHSRYLLVEFPFDHVPSYAEDFFYELTVRGITPVIAHPERNQEIYQKPERLMKLIERGALSQVTASSLTRGEHSKLVQLTLRLCQQNGVHFIASDAHNLTSRPFGLSDAYQIIKKHVSEEHALAYQQNSQCILLNEELKQLPPKKQEKKKWTFFGNK